MKYIVFFLISIVCLSASCNKEHLPEYYFQCKVDGKKYVPDNCANCMVAKVLKDTILLINGNKGFETVGMGLYDGTNVKIKTYLLDGNYSGSADYDNSPQVNDIFKTGSIRTGKLIITTIDKVNKIIAGTFDFEAYNAVQNKTTKISDGKFRLKYTTN